jgi:TonB-linked SusC/RagA family outer membrane protein
MNLKKMKKHRKIAISLLMALWVNVFVCAQTNAQTRTVAGVVTDASGEVVIGASVTIKGTQLGTATDVDGKYSLSVPNENKTLVISYLGMKTKEAIITGNTVNVTLEEDVSILDEVVVIGYGTMKRRDLTGSVASVSGATIAAVPVATAAEAITGKLAGVQVTTTEGSPDANITIRVRGGGSITQSNEPLYIVDGFPVSSITDIATSDIASIDVLKDASSAAIYGSRGANGVIIITTKTGQEGKITVNYNAYIAGSKIANPLQRIDNQDYLKWQYELSLLRGSKSNYEKYFGAYDDMDMYANMQGIDWLNQIYGYWGQTFNHNLSISGGSDKIKYNFNYAHVNNDAIMKNSSYSRDNLSLKLNSKPTETTKLDFSVRYSTTNILGAGSTDGSKTATGMRDSRTKMAMLYPPIPLKVVNLDDADEDMNDNLIDPLTALRDNDRRQRRQSFNAVGSFAWDIFKNFTLKTELGIDSYNDRDSRFYGETSYYSRNDAPTGEQGMPAISMTNKWKNTFRNTNTINYDFKNILNEDHSLNAIVGEETIIGKSETLSSRVTGFPNVFDFEKCLNLTAQGTAGDLDDYYNPDDKLLSFFGRVNYDFKDKYLFSATFRADGSSKFARGNRWGLFPSVSAAWRISDESFMASTQGWLSDLKLRASYGQAGNNNVPSGTMEQYLEPGTSGVTWLANESYWAPNPKIMANPDLTWETTTTRNIALDYALFNTRLSGSLDFYWNTTDDLLIRFPVEGTGYSYQYRNIGQTENRGVELNINYVAIDKKDYGLSFDFNIGFNKNRINSLGSLDQLVTQAYWNSEVLADYIVCVGGAIGEMYGYVSDGRYEVDDFERYDAASDTWILKNGQPTYSDILDAKIRPGSIKLKDVAGNDNKITTADKQVIGNANPLNNGGFSINGRAYGFDLSAQFNWSYGNDVYNANKIEYTSSSKHNYRNMIDIMGEGERWTNLLPDGTITNDPDQLKALNANTKLWSPYMKNFILTDWAVEDASFLRLNTLTLGYTIPKSLSGKLKMQSLRFYASAYNVFCLTNYTGFDPEVSTRSSSEDMPTPGVDYAAYPKSRQFLFGLNLTF